jgi:choline dehydrogenase-like flavoprotein
MPYDVIIIGTGAGGGTLLRRLAPTGLKILVLERGGFLPRERENWDEREVFERKRYQAQETWFDADDKPFRPYTHYFVGGNTKMYGAALLRLRRADFGPIEHHGGVSPAWPVGYEAFEPYYTRAERLYNVRGRRGADPTEPPASGPFPAPPLEPEPRMEELMGDLAACGYKPFPIPLGVRHGAGGPSGAPYRFAAFDGYPDPTEVKADAHVVGVAPTLTYPNVTLIPGCTVDRLEAAGRRVRRVVARRGGERLEFEGEAVVLAAGAINSAAVLLRSACAEHPRGLGNGSGLVGRHYMCHQNGVLIAVTDEPNPSAFQKHFGLADFYHGEPGSALPLGLIQLMGKPDAGTIEWARGVALPGVPSDEVRRRTVDFFITAEDLPDAENRVELTPSGSIRLVYRRNNTEAYERLRARAMEAIGAAEARRGRGAPVFLHARLDVSGVSHQNGTLRFGADPRTSVLNTDCRAHDLDNLYVADASFFPSSGAVNPSLTIMANALRVGDHLARALGAPSAPDEQGAIP